MDVFDWLTPALGARRLGLTTARVKHLEQQSRLTAVPTPLGQRLLDPASVERLVAELAGPAVRLEKRGFKRGEN
jgi:hypothetical protein